MDNPKINPYLFMKLFLHVWEYINVVNDVSPTSVLKSLHISRSCMYINSYD